MVSLGAALAHADGATADRLAGLKALHALIYKAGSLDTLGILRAAVDEALAGNPDARDLAIACIDGAIEQVIRQ